MFRVVFPDFLDRTPIPLGAGISDNNAVIRRVDFSQALEFDLDSHGCGLLPAISVRAVLCRVGTGDNARGGLRIRERERGPRHPDSRGHIVPDTRRCCVIVPVTRAAERSVLRSPIRLLALRVLALGQAPQLERRWDILQAVQVDVGGIGHASQAAEPARRPPSSPSTWQPTSPTSPTSSTSTTSSTSPTSATSAVTAAGSTRTLRGTRSSSTGRRRPVACATRPTALRLLFALLSLAGLDRLAPHPRHTRHPGQPWHARHAAATKHLAHHLLRLEESDDKIANLTHTHARTTRDARPSRAVDDLRVAALPRSHRADNRKHPVQLTVVDLAEDLPVLRRAGEHAEQVADWPELADHHQLVNEVLESEPVAGDQLARHLGGLLLIERLLRLLEEREHVAHVEDPGRHPVRMEQVEVLELLAGGRENDRPTGELGDRQRRTAASIAVQLGKDHAVVTDAVEKRLRRGHGVLTDHRVDHKEDLVGRNGIPDRHGLAHHLFVDAKSACRVNHDHVVLANPCFLHRPARDGYRIAHAVAWLRREHGNPGPRAEHLELLDGVRALQVGGDQDWRVSLCLQPAGQLCRERGLT